MINLYRNLSKGEFIVIGGDCAQGGIDSNIVQCISKDRIDVPIVLSMSGVAAGMTPVLHKLLEWIFDQTGVQPVIALERNMGGASEMERLRKMNLLNKYRLYSSIDIGTTEGETPTDKLGYTTSSVTRPKLVGDLKQAIDSTQLTIYDKLTVDELSTFIVNKNGKPEAAPNTHDDRVMSLAIAWQLYQSQNKVEKKKLSATYNSKPMWVNR